MMQIANTFASRLAVAFVAIAMALSMATPAQAQTVEELQDMIADLMAQVASLSGGSSSSAKCTFTTALTIGSQGAEVTCLQNYLIGAGHSIPAGATGYFGAQTQAAVAAWQAANGVTPAAGYFGPISQAKYAVVAGGTTGGSTGSGDLEGGAGDITVDQTSTGTEDEVLEGEEEVGVLAIDVEADDSDVELTSIRVEFEQEGSGSDRLDRYVEEVTVWLGDDMVGSADVDDFDEDDDVYSENIALDGAVIREDDEATLTVAVTAVNNIDSDDLSQTWEVALGQIRFVDGSGASLTDSSGDGVEAGSSNGAIAEDFAFEDLSTSGDVELTVREDDEEVNDPHTVQVDDSSDTNDVDVLSFTIEADGSDMTLDSLIFRATSTSAGVTEIANDFRLLMDGEEVGDVDLDVNEDGDTSDAGDTFASTTDANVSIVVTNLDDDDVVIEEGDEVTFMLVADINDIDAGFANGASIDIELDSVDVDAEDENGDAVTDLTGSASSDDIRFSASGLMVELTTTDATQVLGLDSTSTDDQGKYEIEFDVTAFEDDAFIELEAASSTDAAGGDFGVAFNVETSANGVAAGTPTATLERVSGGSISGDYVRINSGETATLKLTVYFNPTATGIYRVQMNEVGYAASAAAATAAEDTVPAADFQSESIQVQN